MCGVSMAAWHKLSLLMEYRPSRRFYIFVNGDLAAFVADPSFGNLHPVSAFKKAGFSILSTVQLLDEEFERHVVRLDRIEQKVL